MERIEVLKGLVEKFEDDKVVPVGAWNKVLPALSKTRSSGHLAKAANNGSLDAAKKLHELWVTVPNCYEITMHRVTLYANGRTYKGGWWQNPARGWLLAILKLKLWEAENG